MWKSGTIPIFTVFPIIYEQDCRLVLLEVCSKEIFYSVIVPRWFRWFRGGSAGSVVVPLVQRFSIYEHKILINDLIAGQKILKEQIDMVGNELQNEIIIDNEQHQYNMTAINLKVLGVPKQDGEDVKESKCNITSLDV